MGDARSLAAQSILERLFRNASFGFAARLWDGTRVHLGAPSSEAFTLVFRDPRTFRRLVLRPNTRRFAEAFVEARVDVDGDLFTAVQLAHGIEGLKLGARDRLAILADLWRLGA